MTVDQNALDSMKRRMDSCFKEVMRLTRHTETKRTFLCDLARGVEAQLKAIGEGNLAVEILDKLTQIGDLSREADVLMRLNLDQPGADSARELGDHVAGLVGDYQSAVSRDAPLEQLAQTVLEKSLREPADSLFGAEFEEQESDIPF